MFTEPQRPHREEGHVTTETEIGVRQRMSQGTPRGARSHQKLRDARKDSSLSPERDHGLADGSIQTPGLQGCENTLLLSSATQSVVIWKQRHLPTVCGCGSSGGTESSPRFVSLPSCSQIEGHTPHHDSLGLAGQARMLPTHSPFPLHFFMNRTWVLEQQQWSQLETSSPGWVMCDTCDMGQGLANEINGRL